MRHRMISCCTGFGNSSHELLTNQWSDNDDLNKTVKEMLSEAIDLWFQEYEGVDFTIHITDGELYVEFGVEPAYMYDRLKVFTVSSIKQKSKYIDGKAWGVYGSGIAKKTKCYSECKYNGKFKKFVDKWTERLEQYV